MFRNYLKIALRNLARQKIYSLINVFGLAVGITCCLLIGLYVLQETSYDTFYENVENVYRVTIESDRPNGTVWGAQTPIPLAPQLQTDYPEIAAIGRFLFQESVMFSVDEKKIYESGFAFADPAVFEIFSFKLLQGNREGLLTRPNDIVLTKSLAEKYFGEENPLGKILTYDNTYDFQVRAVIEDQPVNSHLQFNCLVAFRALDDYDTFDYRQDQWGMYTSHYTYVALTPGNNPETFAEKTAGFMDKYSGKLREIPRRIIYQPITEIHLTPEIAGDYWENNSRSNLWIIATIGGFILLIAAINFMNLTTARSLHRTREVGVRKVLGAVKSQLIGQFLGEAILLTFLSLALALAMIELVMPYFAELIGKPLDVAILGYGNLLGLLLLAAVLIGGLSGFYPALFLAAARPATTLKGRGLSGKGSGLRPNVLRKYLVVLQFTISIALIIGTLIVRNQLQYMMTAPLGFEKAFSVSLPINADMVQQRYETVKHELNRHPNVLGTTACFKSPIGEYNFVTSLYPESREKGNSFSIAINSIDGDFIEQFGLALLAGRNFQTGTTLDSMNAYIINETAMKMLGYNDPDAIIGKRFPLGIYRLESPVIGVIKDFHNRTLQSTIRPLVMLYWPNQFYELAVKVKPENFPETLAHLESVMNTFDPDHPFDYTFLDEDIAGFYQAEMQVEKIIGVFSLIAIVIACLGLFGLAAYTAERRTKEIGIRKVLGASITSIFILLSGEFLKLILLAGVVSAPMAYLAMNQWLQSFAYRINIDVLTLIFAGSLAIMVAILTIGYQAIKAARSNPVDALRYE